MNFFCILSNIPNDVMIMPYVVTEPTKLGLYLNSLRKWIIIDLFGKLTRIIVP